MGSRPINIDTNIRRIKKGVDRRMADLKEKAVRRRFTLPHELRKADRISSAISSVKIRWPEACKWENDEENPVFVFSAGWRSGSTLLQRLIMSSGEVVIWGEPLGDAAIIPRMAGSISTIGHGWPSDTFFPSTSRSSVLSREWIANLTPDMRYLRSAHRAFLLEWLGVPAREKFGVERWGLKEVRLTIHHARYIKWLFPNARFVFIYRNPFEAYRSWKGNRWRSVWPGYYSRSPIAFARHWRLLLKGFLRDHGALDGSMVKFEDLISNEFDLNRLASHLAVASLDKSVLEQKVSAPRGILPGQKPALNLYERAMIRLVCGSLLSRLEYQVR